MDSTDLAILRQLRDGPARARSLIEAGVPRTTAYRRLTTLAEEGLLDKNGHHYRLTPAGEACLEQQESGAPGDALQEAEEHLPHLRHMPHPLYRAVLFLVACAISARSHRLLDQHHAGFVLFGRRLKWKTWLGRVACHLAGEDPNKNVVYAPSESGRSLHSRRNATGETVTNRDAFQSRLVVLDEFLRADPQVRKLAQVHLFGQLSYPFENEQIDAPAVPIICTNPIQGQDRLEGKLGLDEAMLRRIVPVCVDGVEIPPDLLTEGDVILERIAELDPVSFPQPELRWIPRAEVRTALQASLQSPERLADIDLIMVAQLAAGATAWLQKESAVRAVLVAYLTVVTELGWTLPDWPLRLHDALAEGERRDFTTPPPTTAPSPPPSSSRGSFDHGVRVDVLLQACNELGIDPNEAKSRLELAAALHGQGLTVQDVHDLGEALKDTQDTPLLFLRAFAASRDHHQTLLRQVGDLEAERIDVATKIAQSRAQLAQVRSELTDLKLAPEELAQIRWLRELVVSQGVEGQVLAKLLKTTRELSLETGAPPGQAAEWVNQLQLALMQEVRGDPTVSGDAAVAQLARLSASGSSPTQEGYRLDKALELLRAQRAELESQVAMANESLECRNKRLRACREALREDEARLEELRQAIAWEHHELARVREVLTGQRHHVAFVADVTAFLTSELSPNDAVWAWLDQLRFGCQAQRLTRSQVSVLTKRIKTRLKRLLGNSQDTERSPS